MPNEKEIRVLNEIHALLEEAEGTLDDYLIVRAGKLFVRSSVTAEHTRVIAELKAKLAKLSANPAHPDWCEFLTVAAKARTAAKQARENAPRKEKYPVALESAAAQLVNAAEKKDNLARLIGSLPSYLARLVDVDTFAEIEQAALALKNPPGPFSWYRIRVNLKQRSAWGETALTTHPIDLGPDADIDAKGVLKPAAQPTFDMRTIATIANFTTRIGYIADRILAIRDTLAYEEYPSQSVRFWRGDAKYARETYKLVSELRSLCSNVYKYIRALAQASTSPHFGPAIGALANIGNSFNLLRAVLIGHTGVGPDSIPQVTWGLFPRLVKLNLSLDPTVIESALRCSGE